MILLMVEADRSPMTPLMAEAGRNPSGVLGLLGPHVVPLEAETGGSMVLVVVLSSTLVLPTHPLRVLLVSAPFCPRLVVYILQLHLDTSVE